MEKARESLIQKKGRNIAKPENYKNVQSEYTSRQQQLAKLMEEHYSK